MRPAQNAQAPREASGEGSVLVTGCGKEAVYIERCATCEEYMSGTGEFWSGRRPQVTHTNCRCAYLLAEPVRPRTASVAPRP